MKRLRVILLFLLLGAIINVAVAWWGFQLSDDKSGIFEWRVPIGNYEKELWSRHASDGWPDMPIGSPDTPMTYRRWYGLLTSGRYIGVISVGGGIIPPNMTYAEERERSRGLGSFKVSQIDAGFPLRSMRIEEWSGNPDQQFFTATEGHDAFYFSGLIIPKHPIWSGVIINTLFYAYLLWLLIPLLYTLRCMIRNKHGLCPHCAYDLRGTDHVVCPECGIAIVKAKPA